MKKFTILLIALFLIGLSFNQLFAQTDKEVEQAKSWLGQWKRNFASPTVGVTLFRANLDGRYLMNVPDSEIDFPLTAAEIRIFKGVNVSKRGGFYTGVETGLFFMQNVNELTFPESNLGEMHLNYQAGLVFLMAKFGLRMDIGIALFGVSLGGEIGIGGTMFSGGFDFSTTSTSGEEIMEGYGNAAANMGVIADASVEGAIRLGKNFRLVAKAGVVAAPIDSERKDSDFYYQYTNQGDYSSGWYWNGIPLTDGSDDEKRAILNNYQVEIDPFAIDLRVGFILNFS